MFEMATRRKKCRLWWPENLSSHAPLHFSYLFGWFVSSSESSVDIVVDFACDEPSLSSSIAPRSDVPEFLRVTNKNMPASLQNKCKFYLLGSYVADHSVNGQSAVYENDKKTCRNLATNGQCLSRIPNACPNNSWSLGCGCHKLDGLSEQFGLTALGIMWIKLVCGLTETVGQRIRVIPKFDHLHWNGEMVFQLDIHDHGKRSHTCVEFAEKAAFHMHLMWSNIVVDIFLGNLFGIVLWYSAEPCCLWVSSCANYITNHCLRTSVWLMGNPAGFKLNTELAGVLGMISLNGIQIWSTLWVFMSFLFVRFLKGLAICGIFFGLTTAAALIIDTISIATIHVLTLHLFLSLLYSSQIQTVAALWRLFRGRKWNPLRQRLDSYDYTVEQHVVGSLLFTPILLLLPTTSAFYIFFSSFHTAVSFICLVIGMTISIIHATPYFKIFIWLKRKKRFPSGIWFEVASCKCIETGAVNDGNNSTQKLHNKACASGKSRILVSFLRSNYLNLGEVVWPHYGHIYGAFSKSSIISSAYSLLSGTSTQYPNMMGLPSKVPWMMIPWKEYWSICHDSVYACRPSYM